MVLTTPESIIEQASTRKLLDDLIDESVRTSARRPIMMQFDPSSGWIWRRWKGTVFSETWHSAVTKMAYATLIFFVFRSNPAWKQHLQGFSILWGQLLSVTTFTLTFFLNQSYALWRKCYELSRRLQGRLNDLGMTLAAHAARKTPASPTEPSTYTAASRQLLELVSRYIRLFNLLTYASFTRSHRPVLTPRGMRRLVERGLLTTQEREVLVDAEIPATQRHNALILWIIRAFIEGRQAGHIVGGAGFENQFMEKIHVIRAQYGGIGDELQGRMPLAYAHIVQVLVDVILWMYPIMSFSSEMSPVLGVLGTGLLTMFYQGLFDLAKQFLDPYDNENYGKGDDPLCVDTLIAETNAGSVRWMNGFDGQPFSSQKLRDGELFEYLLPRRGYSLEELVQMEEDRIQKEKEREEKREREEAERIKREEEEALEKEEEEEERQLVESFLRNQTLANATDVVVDFTATELEQDAEPNQESIPIEVICEPVDDGDLKKVHKVYTLEDGTPVTIEEEISPEKWEVVNMAENATQLVTVSVNGDSPVLPAPETENITATDLTAFKINMMTSVPESETAVSADDEVDDDKYIHSLIDFEMFQDLDWHDEVTEDGKEYRLSEQLADDVWEEELQAELKNEAPLTYEDYTSRAMEIMEAAESELLETAEILGAAPGAQTSIISEEKSDGVAPRLPEPLRPDRKEQSRSIKYDQTKLDGISQLWGLPPEDSTALEGYPEPATLDYDESRFDGISQLWGETSASPAALKDSTMVDSAGDFAGITQLWGEDALDAPMRLRTASRKSTTGGDGQADNSASLPFDIDKSMYAGLEWFDEVGPDGKEYRLSEMLAEEEWEMEPEPSYADFKKEEEAFLKEVEEEMLETQAILMAPPGADSPDPYEEKVIKSTKDNISVNVTDPSFGEFLTETEEELLETEAILMAPPGTDSPDPSEAKEIKPIQEETSVNATGVDVSLEALEMDVDDTETDLTVTDHVIEDVSADAEAVEKVSVEGATADLTIDEETKGLEDQGDRGDVDDVNNP
jgi:predicted membrane chloride channel (bestrophin family)